MADYCKQCSIKYFGEDYRDFAGIISESQVKKGYGAVVICEGCGPTIVNQDGECIAQDCEDHKGTVPSQITTN